LRYLGIKCGGSIPKLSKQITNLKFLQTLVVSGTLLVNIVLPTQLLCLHAGWSVPNGIEKLTSLEELRVAGYTKMFVKELGSLRELRVLTILNKCYLDKSMQRDFVVSLSNLEKIKKIDIGGMGSIADTAMWEAAGFVLPQSLRHLNLWICFSKLPSCINPSRLPNLSHLRLWVDTMDEQDMKHLACCPRSVVSI
jgi:disease resistance protein RPM1